MMNSECGTIIKYWTYIFKAEHIIILNEDISIEDMVKGRNLMTVSKEERCKFS